MNWLAVMEEPRAVTTEDLEGCVPWAGVLSPLRKRGVEFLVEI
jgi:hypothetical protein